MKRFMAFLLVLSLSLPGMALVEGDQVMYVGGSAKDVTAGVMGRLNTTSDDSLTFEYQGGKLAIPYERIEAYDYKTEVGQHLGVLSAVAVSLVKRRWRKHFIHISYRDEAGKMQAVVFEVAKTAPATLVPILRTKTAENCKKKKMQPIAGIPRPKNPSTFYPVRIDENLAGGTGLQPFHGMAEVFHCYAVGYRG